MTGDKGILSRRAEWIKAGVAEFLPEEKALITSDGQRINYKYLLLACDYERDLDAVDGLREALEYTVDREADEQRAVVTCCLSLDDANAASDAVDATKGGEAIFVQPRNKHQSVSDTFSMAFLASERWKEQHKEIAVSIATGNDEIFLAPKYADTLRAKLAEANIDAKLDYQLAAVRPEQREADFLTRHANGGLLVMETRPFDFMFVTPPLKPTAALQGSALVNGDGFVDVSHTSLRHKTYNSVFAIGESAGVPTFKCTAAALSQARIVTHNILNSPFSWTRINDVEEQATREGQIKKGEVDEYYFGYSCNPIQTSRTHLLLAETDYQYDPAETFLFDQGTPGRFVKYLGSFWPSYFWKHQIRGKSWAFGPHYAISIYGKNCLITSILLPTGKFWAFGPHYIRAAQLGDSPWKYVFTKYHKSERQD